MNVREGEPLPLRVQSYNTKVTGFVTSIFRLKNNAYFCREIQPDNMDQPKIERLLRLMQYLSSNTNYTLDEIARNLDTSRRSLFRYIDTLKTAGFSVSRVGEGVYQMTTYNKEFSDLSQLVYFTDEEAIVVSRLIENLEGTNALKAGLRRKLAAVYDSTSISDYAVKSGKSDLIDILAEAVKQRKQVQLKDYSSNHSGKTKDYVLEPYKFTKEFVDIIAYDVKEGINKVFKISRIGDVKILGDWEHEDAHQEQPIDSFRMSGSPVEHVKLRMTLRAKNLMSEEFPITGEQVYSVKRTWYWEGDINALEGIGRFVLGLASEIDVEEGEQLKTWLTERGSYIQHKFRK